MRLWYLIGASQNKVQLKTDFKTLNFVTQVGNIIQGPDEQDSLSQTQQVI